MKPDYFVIRLDGILDFLQKPFAPIYPFGGLFVPKRAYLGAKHIHFYGEIIGALHAYGLPKPFNPEHQVFILQRCMNTQ